MGCKSKKNKIMYILNHITVSHWHYLLQTFTHTLWLVYINHIIIIAYLNMDFNNFS